MIQTIRRPEEILAYRCDKSWFSVSCLSAIAGCLLRGTDPKSWPPTRVSAFFSFPFILPDPALESVGDLRIGLSSEWFIPHIPWKKSSISKPLIVFGNSLYNLDYCRSNQRGVSRLSVLTISTKSETKMSSEVSATSTGRLVAEMMTGATPFCDPKPFSSDRFT